ncbi:hypothetical protein WICPIJ_007463 [Wickerhamomyces pijperi]|uniref:Uncharacterized protein n=1 Tax=Wickerhamomyces pijperi TaxID=599730 RepID=A0A9P8TJY4_WICPI|nr:hypothetical protein WICPIJ_007463 [Wickerhamomyces pijperi]
MLADLNIPWPQNDYTPLTTAQLAQLKNTIITAETLGYTHLAINFTVNIHEIKIPGNDINPIIKQLDNFEKLKEFTARGLKFFSRITLIIENPNQGQNLSKFLGSFNILSIAPTTEKALILACGNSDVDIITFDYSKRMNFYLKHKTVGGGVKKGIKFEICYNSLVSSNSLEKQSFLTTFNNLVRVSRNQNLVISSGATSCLNLRNFNNVLTFCKNLGFRENKVFKNTESVLLGATLKSKSYKQTVMIGENPVHEDVTGKRNIKEIDSGDVFKEQLKRIKLNKQATK